MPLLAETGAGIPAADTYADRATVLAYWANRPNSAFATTVAAAVVTNLDGAIREATTFLDAAYGPFYKGVRRGRVQGLLWPRTGAADDASYPLPDLPPELPVAVAELAARALSATLQGDINSGTRIKSLAEKVGPIGRTTEYFDAGTIAPKTSYGVVTDILAPLLNGRQPGAPAAAWNWS